MEADLGTIAAVVLDPDNGDIHDGLHEHSALGSHLLILDRVVCDMRFAGRQVGRWIAAEAIEAMSPGLGIVAAVAAPLDGSTGVTRDQSSAKLQDVWASIGFVVINAELGVTVLNPELRTNNGRLQDLRARFGIS